MGNGNENGKAGKPGNGREKIVTDAELLDRESVAQAAGEMPLEGDADGGSMLSRLALSSMGVKPELSIFRPGDPDSGKSILQAVIFGELTGLTGPKELPNAKSDAEKYTFGLKGRIEGCNVLTGEMFKAAVLYLPAGFHDMFLAEMESQLASAQPGFVIAFALEFYSIAASNPRGYSWKAVNKMPSEKRDPLARLRARAMQGVTVTALSSPGAQKQLV